MPTCELGNTKVGTFQGVLTNSHSRCKMASGRRVTYNSYGAKLSGNSEGGLNGGIDVTRRGFTDHEHLDEVEFIHMD